MKLINIKNIETLNVAQSQTVKGGSRDTRTDQTATATPIMAPIKKRITTS